MKILHALVGYLAVTAMPFHPFAFASPATIDYDGYVKTTQNHIDDGALIKHVLDTCQSITYHSDYVNTTQTHTDSPVMKRVPASGDIQLEVIEARQAVVIIPPVVAIISLIAIVTLSIIWIKDDNPVRGNDVEFLVERFD